MMRQRPSRPVAGQPVEGLSDAVAPADSPARRSRAAADPVYRRARQIRAFQRLLLKAALIVCCALAVGVLALAGARLTLRRLESSFDGRIFPRVYALGVPLGGLNASEAAAALAQPQPAALAEPAQVALRDRSVRYSFAGRDLGVHYDVEASVREAMAVGRGTGSWPAHLAAWFRQQNLAAIWAVDAEPARAALTQIQAHTAEQPKEASLRLQGDRLIAVPGEPGRALDVDATLIALANAVRSHTGSVEVELAFRPVPPRVGDARPALAQAEAMLKRQVTLAAYDIPADEAFSWSLDRATLAAWLRVLPAAGGQGASGGSSLIVQADRAALRSTLAGLADGLSEGRGLRLDEATDQVLAALAAGGGRVNLYLTHPTRTYAVEPGDTFEGIAAGHGLPTALLAQANPGIDIELLSVGQELTIPSVDLLLPHMPVPGKRIVISIEEQRLDAYEQGKLRWSWPCSTGRSAAPTRQGAFQVLEKAQNAYDSQRGIWMPSFLSIYRSPAGSFAGIHGLPIGASGQRLWASELGRPASYGCIVLGASEAATLYDWAEVGVPVIVK